MITFANTEAAAKDLAQNGVYQVCGSGAPTSGTSGTGVGITGIGSYYTDFATGNGYIQVGTLASPLWQLDNGPATLQQLSGVISAAAIIATAAGSFGHANGVIMVPAGGTHVVTEVHSVVLQSKFGVAAFTAGGNITVNQGAGGAAITGLVSAANSLGNAASKSIMLVPLSTASTPLVENGPINLVSSAAFTNPGTAAGTLSWTINFRQYATGF